MKHYRPVVVAMLLPLVIGLAACTGEPISTGSSAEPEHTRTSDGPAASTTTALKDGLLIRRKSDDGGLTYAVVDVDSGALRQTIQFPGKRGTTFSYRAQAYSHDWTRHAVTVVTTEGDQHAGWVDQTGRFTDFTASVHGASSGFGGSVHHAGVGFDRDGRFLYNDNTVRTKKIMATPGLGESGVVLASGDGYLADMQYVWDYTGTLRPNLGFECRPTGIVGWAAHEEFVYLDTESPGRATNAAEQIRIGNTSCDGHSNDTMLLPKENKRAVSNAAVSPDHTRVAFLSNAGGFQGMFIVPVTGGAPQRTGVSANTLQGWDLMGWL